VQGRSPGNPPLLAVERKGSQNPDPLNPKGSATRNCQTSALTYWSGIIQLRRHANRKNAKRWATRQDK
jgi:hypothetical protein